MATAGVNNKAKEYENLYMFGSRLCTACDVLQRNSFLIALGLQERCNPLGKSVKLQLVGRMFSAGAVACASCTL
jgi:hypothetical protein